MKCIEKINRKDGCARNGHFGVPKSIYRAQKKMFGGVFGVQLDSLFFFMARYIDLGTLYGQFGHTPLFDIFFRYISSI